MYLTSGFRIAILAAAVAEFLKKVRDAVLTNEATVNLRTGDARKNKCELFVRKILMHRIDREKDIKIKRKSETHQIKN